MKKIKIAILFFTLISCASAQKNLDSLWGIWENTAHPDTTRLMALWSFTRHGHLDSEPDSAIYFLQKGYDFARTKGLVYPMSQALNYSGLAYVLKGEYPPALDYYDQSLLLLEENDLKEKTSPVLLNIGYVYSQLGNDTKALIYYKKSLSVAEEVNDKSAVPRALNGIGSIYLIHGDYPNAITYFTKSLEIVKELDEKRDISAALCNIGSVYLNQREYKKALDYYESSILLSQELRDKGLIASTMSNIGAVYSNMGDDLKALDYYHKGLQIQMELGNAYRIANYLINAGLSYQKLEEPKKSILECEEAYLLALEVGGLTQQKGACKCLYDGYKMLGNYSKALSSYEKMQLLEDSLRSKETVKKLQIMEFEKQQLADSLEYTAELQKKEAINQKNKVIQKKDARIKQYFATSIIGSVFTLSLIIMALGIRNQSKKRQIALNQAAIENHRLNEKSLKDKLKYLREQLNTESKVPDDTKQDKASLAEKLKPNNWLEILNEFNGVYHGLVDRLKEKYPSLSRQDIKTVAMIKMDLSLKETAHLLAVSEAAVSKAKLRLRNKLELKKSSEIRSFIDDFWRQHC